MLFQQENSAVLLPHPYQVKNHQSAIAHHVRHHKLNCIKKQFSLQAQSANSLKFMLNAIIK
jgi:hypothetical protein